MAKRGRPFGNRNMNTATVPAERKNILLKKRYYGYAPGCVIEVGQEEGNLLVSRGVGEWTAMASQAGCVVVPQKVVKLGEVNGWTSIDWSAR